MRKGLLTAVVLMLSTASIVCGQQGGTDSWSRPVEIFQLQELPLNVHEAVVIEKRPTRYQVRLRLSNESNTELKGFRYSIVIMDLNEEKFQVQTRSEAFELAAHDSKELSCALAPTYYNFDKKLRFILMLEQVISSDSIWEVIKPKDALVAFLNGDYSTQPKVIKASNAVDAPPQIRVVY